VFATLTTRVGRARTDVWSRRRKARRWLRSAVLLVELLIGVWGGTGAGAWTAGPAAPAGGEEDEDHDEDEDETEAGRDAQPEGRKLGRLERESVDDALAGAPLIIDPRPQGKRIGRIDVRNQEVFSPRDRGVRWLNALHRTTRNEVLARELTVKQGQVYDEDLVQESIRHLQSPPELEIEGEVVYAPEWSSVVAILPVVSPRAGEVDLLVVTRDIWSLRFNTEFDYQQDTLAHLEMSLAENNLLGWRKHVSANFVLDQGTKAFGPTYFDPNIRGTRLMLFASALFWHSRADGRYEGNNQTFALRYPLYALDSRWGAGLDVTHGDIVSRRFRGNDLWLEDLPGTPERELLPHIFRARTATIDAGVVRSFRGSVIVQRFQLGHRFQRRHAAVLADFPGDDAAADLFLETYAPLPEQRSEPYLGYELFTPRYAVLRDLDSFDLRENRRLGPSVAARLWYGLPALGSDVRAPGAEISAGWATDAGVAFAELFASASARLRDGDLVDQRLYAEAFLASPIAGGLGRLVLGGQMEIARADTEKTVFLVGGRTGLRGYAIGDFKGPAMAVGHVELRSAALSIRSQRLGAVLFYDVGHAASSASDLIARHDAGLGLRWLVPQLNSSVIRLDWAFASHRTALTEPGWPGRLTAGFRQAF
jgi:hypothetical protein